MYTTEDLKKILKKTNKLAASLKRARLSCSSVIYTEQNTEELNDVKAFIEYKIDLLTEIITLINNFLKGKLNCNVEEMSETLNLYREQFNAISKDAHLKRLQEIYTRKINEETPCL